MQQQSPPSKKPRPGERQFIIPATNPLLRCANLIIPWLRPRDLSAVSLTCKTLSLISRSLTFRRSLDATRSLENFPVPFCNAVDSQRYAYFIYTPFQIPASSNPPPQWWGSATRESDGAGDNPASPLPGDDDGWIPHSKSENVSVSERGRFGVSLVDESGERMFGCECERCEDGYCQCLAFAGTEEIANECGPGCGCGSGCPNRVTQKGISVRLKIVRDEKKGWCLHADQLIKKGQFICEYAGELLTTDEARRRQSIYDKLRSTQSFFASALLVIREHLPSGQACLRINIDATRIGNVARFINHSCDGGNLSTVLLRSSGALLPRLCFFAARDIMAEEELCFSYGDVRVTEKNRDGKLNCSCGSSCCFGTLPCENT
uniref:Histone-lysine N-methyltransferase SUVR3 n=1 Tax=Noccaea caerulescens TaxID=107243 RepID=A0A1J3DRU2_NOCCA